MTIPLCRTKSYIWCRVPDCNAQNNKRADICIICNKPLQSYNNLNILNNILNKKKYNYNSNVVDSYSIP